MNFVQLKSKSFPGDLDLHLSRMMYDFFFKSVCLLSLREGNILQIGLLIIKHPLPECQIIGNIDTTDTMGN